MFTILQNKHDFQTNDVEVTGVSTHQVLWVYLVFPTVALVSIISFNVL